MATPTIQIDQTPLSAGSPGVSRDDLALDIVVDLTDPANGAGLYAWTLDPPPGSSATLTGAATATPSFTPDVIGTYLVYLTFDNVEFSFSLDADENKVSTMGGASVNHFNGTRSLGVGETRQYSLTKGYADDFDPYFAVIDAAAGLALGAGFESFTFEEGSEATGPRVFGVWADLYDALVAARVASGGNTDFDLWMDDATTSTMSLTAGTFDLDRCRLRGPKGRSQGNNVLLEIPEGVILENAFEFEDIRIVHKASATSPIVPTPAQSFRFTNCRLYALSPAAVPFFDGSAFLASGPDWFEIILTSSSLGAFGAATELIDINLGRLELRLRGHSSFAWDDIIDGIATSIFRTTKQGRGSSVSFDQANFLGTNEIEDLSTEGARVLYHNPGAAAAAFTSAQGSVGSGQSRYWRGDVSGGAFAFTMTAAAFSATPQGRVVIVSEESGNTGLTVAPLGADLINGANTAVNVPAGGNITLLGDGIDGWRVINVYDPAAFTL